MGTREKMCWYALYSSFPSSAPWWVSLTLGDGCEMFNSRLESTYTPFAFLGLIEARWESGRSFWGGLLGLVERRWLEQQQ